MKKISIFMSLLLIIALSSRTRAQVAYRCMQDSISQFMPVLPCSPSSFAYITKYSRANNYFPLVTDSIVTLKYTLHIFNRADSTGLWPNHADSVNSMITQLDSMAGFLFDGYTDGSSFRVASYMPGFNPPIFGNTKIRYLLTNIYFYNDDALNNIDSYNNMPGATSLFNHIASVDPARLDEGMPVIISKSFVGSTYVGFAQSYNGKPYVQTSIGAHANLWVHSLHMRHEIGHCVGWWHTYDSETLICSSPEFLSDVFPQDPACGGPPGCQVCYEDTIRYSNNVMCMKGGGTWTSQLQVGRRMRAFCVPNFGVGDIRSFMKDMRSDQGHLWIVDTNETWDFDLQSYRDIVVKAGATLRITCKVAMAIGGKIVVKKGARLIIDGGEVTGWCKTGFWKGIEVEGDASAGQLIYNPTGLAADFGVVKVINGGTVSKAEYGINNFRTDNNFNIMWGTQGGIIQCEDANFINNYRDVQFLSYNNMYGNDLSYFKKCNFKTTGLLINGVVPTAHVSLWDVRGIYFWGCNFEYDAGNAYAVQDRGTGIYSMDARYFVDEICNNNSNPCNDVTKSEFKKLTIGVRVDNSNPLNVVSIKNSNFHDNNSYGAFFNTINYPVFENNFIHTAGDNYAVGLYLNKNKYYTIKNNTFVQDTTTSPSDLGMYAEQSQTGAHYVYRNSFANFNLALGALNDNSGVFNMVDGLRMNCNDFTPKPSNYNIAVLGSVWHNVMKVQGVTAGSPSPTDLVRNKYSTVSCTNENKWHVAGTSVQTYQHGCNSDAVARPDLPSASCKDAAVNVVAFGPLNYALHCPTELPNGGNNNGGGLGGINIALGNAKTHHNSAASTYNSSIDGGNTIALLDSIQNSAISPSSLKALLNNSSPYLSDAVLLAYLRSPSTPSGNRADIAIANSPVTPPVKAVLDSLPFTPITRMSINNAQTGVSARSGLEQELSLAKFDLQAVCAEKLNYFLLDTTVAAQDSVIHLLQTNEGNMQDADIQLIYAYMQKGDSVAAQTAINHLPPARATWAGLLNKQQKLAYGHKKAYKLLDDEGLLEDLETHAATAYIEGQASAQSLLCFIAGIPYSVPHLLPEEPSSHRADAQSGIGETVLPQNGARVRLYPNPTQNGMNVLYESKASVQLKVEVRDLLGKLIFSTSISSNTAHYLPLDNYSSGVYILTLHKDGELVYTTKLIKQE